MYNIRVGWSTGSRISVYVGVLGSRIPVYVVEEENRIPG